MKNMLIFLFVLLMAHNSWATDIETRSALLQALDKTTGRTSFLTVKVGEPYAFGDLTVLVKKCMKRPPEETPENSVYLTVSEAEDKPIFQGWMFSSNPALSSMEHPVYDIWVVECKSAEVSSAIPRNPEPELVDVADLVTEDLED